jgi:prepilin-type N-terminal cleavage/methylation domain-containing protein
MKKLLGNKGFTLLEMVVAFALLGVMMVTVTLVIGTSSNTYSKIATDINLQYESQLAMSQLQEYIIDCDAGIGAGPDGSLYIVNKNGSGYEAFKFARLTDADALYFYKASMDTFNPGAADFSAIAFDSGQLMSSYVEGFSAGVSASSVTVSIEYGTGSETYNARQTFALRNQVPTISAGTP